MCQFDVCCVIWTRVALILLCHDLACWETIKHHENLVVVDVDDPPTAAWKSLLSRSLVYSDARRIRYTACLCSFEIIYFGWLETVSDSLHGVSLIKLYESWKDRNEFQTNKLFLCMFCDHNSAKTQKNCYINHWTMAGITQFHLFVDLICQWSGNRNINRIITLKIEHMCTCYIQFAYIIQSLEWITQPIGNIILIHHFLLKLVPTSCVFWVIRSCGCVFWRTGIS